jgi:DNA-binding Lrp family transcriptional regulator
MKLKQKERAVLRELILNSRISMAALARKVGISREVALYSVNKLKKDIIKKFFTIIDTEKLGFQRHGCCMQLKDITVEEEADFIRYLAEHDNVTYLGPTMGRWNVAFDILSKDDEDLKRVIDELSRKVPNKIENIIIIGTSLKAEMFPTKIVGVIAPAHKTKTKKLKALKIDAIDKQILALLTDNSRVEYAEMAKKLKMTPNSIKYRIRNLERAEIIQGYSLSVDMKKLGFDVYNLRLKTTNDQKTKNVITFLRNHPQVIYYYQHIGHENWNLDVGMMVEDASQLREFIIDVRKNFPDSISLFEVYLIPEETKGNYPSKNLLRNC